MNFEPQHIVVRSRHIFICLDGMLLVLLTVSALVLTGCEGRSVGSGSGPAAQDRTIQVDAPVGLSIDPLLPPGSDDRPALPGETGRQRSADGLPILDPKGPNLKQMFREDIKDPIDRIKRVENAVLEMRQDLDSVLPAINRLVSIEGDIQALTTQLQALLSEENVPSQNAGSSVTPEEMSSSLSRDSDLSPRLEQGNPEPINATEAPMAPNDSDVVVTSGEHAAEDIHDPSPGVSGQAHHDIQDVLLSLDRDVVTIDSIRIGNHPDKVRIVIDSPVNVAVTTDLDPQEHVLVVDLPGVDMQPGARDVASNALIKSISLNKSTGGAPGGQAVFELKKNVQIKRSTVMPPTEDQKQFRILIDVAE